MTWTEEEEAQVDNALAKLAVCTRTDIDAVGLAAYSEALAGRKATDVVEACRRLMATEKFMPSAGVVADVAKAISADRLNDKLEAERKKKRAASTPMPERVKTMIDDLVRSFNERVGK